VLEAYKVFLQLRHGPATLVLTRQARPTFDRSKFGPASGVAKGAYVLADAANGKPEVILMASGSEVQLCMAAYAKLQAENINARVVSMPSWELFEKARCRLSGERVSFHITRARFRRNGGYHGMGAFCRAKGEGHRYA